MVIAIHRRTPIIAGAYFNHDFFTFVGIVKMIDGMGGLMLRKNLGKEEVDKIGVLIEILSFGLNHYLSSCSKSKILFFEFVAMEFIL